MQIKTFRGQSYSELLQKVKSELGPDAVILSSDCVSSNGKKTYEITAALEKHLQEMEESESEPSQERQTENNNLEGNSGLDSTAPQSDGEWRQEWESFKNSIFKMIKPQIQGPRITSRQKQILDYLEKQGVHPEVIMDLWSQLGENFHLPTLQVLTRSIPVSPWHRFLKQSKVHAFMGPSGVGKTTTVLRLALESRNKNPDMKICLVNTDAQHAGGRLFLKHYADLSGFTFQEAKTDQELKNLIQTKNDFDLIFLDTPGFHAPDREENAKQDQIFGDMCRHLVLSPVYASAQIDHYLNQYRQLKLNSLIWTKLDEAFAFGTLMNVSWKSGLPISYLCFDKGLRNSSAAATQDNLWKLIFKKRVPRNTNKK